MAGLGRGLWDGPVLICGFLRKGYKRIASGTELEVKHEEQVQAAKGEEGCLHRNEAGGRPLAEAGWRAVSEESWQVKYFHV